MDQIFSAIVNFKKNLESLLENDLHKNHEEIDTTKKNFEVSRDPQLIRSLANSLPDDHTDRAIAIFSRLSYLFDAGVFLENMDGLYKVQAYFDRGVIEPYRLDPRPVLTLPHTDLLTVLTTSSSSILEKCRLPDLDPSKDGKALLLKLTPDFSILLISHMPDLWLKGHIEQVLENLHRGMSEA